MGAEVVYGVVQIEKRNPGSHYLEVRRIKEEKLTRNREGGRTWWWGRSDEWSEEVHHLHQRLSLGQRRLLRTDYILGTPWPT